MLVQLAMDFLHISYNYCLTPKCIVCKKSQNYIDNQQRYCESKSVPFFILHPIYRVVTKKRTELYILFSQKLFYKNLWNFAQLYFNTIVVTCQKFKSIHCIVLSDWLIEITHFKNKMPNFSVLFIKNHWCIVLSYFFSNNSHFLFLRAIMLPDICCWNIFPILYYLGQLTW